MPGNLRQLQLRVFSAGTVGALAPAIVEAAHLARAAPHRLNGFGEWLFLLSREWASYALVGLFLATLTGLALGAQAFLRKYPAAIGQAFASGTLAAFGTWWLSAFWSERSAPLYALRHLPLGVVSYLFFALGAWILLRIGKLDSVSRIIARVPTLAAMALTLVSFQWLFLSYFPDSIPYFHFRMSVLHVCAWMMIVFARWVRPQPMLRGITLSLALLAVALLIFAPTGKFRVDATLRSQGTEGRSIIYMFQQTLKADRSGREGFASLRTFFTTEGLRTRPQQLQVRTNFIEGPSPKSLTFPSPTPQHARVVAQNLIWVSLDTVREDDSRKRLSSLNRFRVGGIDFRNAYTAHVGTHFSLPSTASSRLLPATVSPSQYITVASALSAGGFLTVSVTELGIKPQAGTPSYLDGFQDVSHDTTVQGIEQVTSGLRGMQGRKFLWIHDLGAHMPRFSAFSQRAFSDTWKRPEYNRLLNESDSWLRDVLELLERQGWFEDSVIVIFSDHGELMGEHGRFFHAKTPYEPLARIPLVIRYPGALHESRDESVSAIDIAPTSLELLGLSPPASFEGVARIDAQITTPVVTMHSLDDWCTDRTLEYSVIDSSRTWKLVHSYIYGFVELYRVSEDARELHDVAPSHPQIVSDLKKTFGELTKEGWPQRSCEGVK